MAPPEGNIQGVPALYLGIFLTYVWAALVVGAGFHWGGWIERATDMMVARGSRDEEKQSS